MIIVTLYGTVVLATVVSVREPLYRPACVGEHKQTGSIRCWEKRRTTYVLPRKLLSPATQITIGFREITRGCIVALRQTAPPAAQCLVCDRATRDAGVGCPAESATEDVLAPAV
jgi:hypothetical protein